MTNVIDISKRKKAIQACYDNSHDLINKAKMILDNEGSSIAYTLAIYALEEVGKAIVLSIDGTLTHFNKEFGSIDKVLDDHNKKLFWAMWFPSLGGEHTSVEKVIEITELAQNLHKDRVDSLYVSHTNNEPILKIPRIKTEGVIKMAELRLSYQEMNSGILDLSKIEDYKWFIDAYEDSAKKQFIFSRSSLDKLASFELSQTKESMYSWVKWLRSEELKQKQEMNLFLQQEIMRKLPEGDKGLTPKWKKKFTLIALSHSIRAKELEFWNNQCKNTGVQLHAGDKKNSKSLFIEITIPSRVGISDVWSRSDHVIRLLLLALNIGSLGLFYWYFLGKNEELSETIQDLESGKRIEYKPQSPYTNIDWGHKVFDNDTIQRVMLCFSGLLYSETSSEHQKPFDQYLQALAFLAKSDTHLNLIANACALFFNALKSAMNVYNDLNLDEKFTDSFARYFAVIISNPEELEIFVLLINKLENATNNQEFTELTFDKALQIKSLCDAYFYDKFYIRMKKVMSIDTNLLSKGQELWYNATLKRMSLRKCPSTLVTIMRITRQS